MKKLPQPKFKEEEIEGRNLSRITGGIVFQAEYLIGAEQCNNRSREYVKDHLRNVIAGEMHETPRKLMDELMNGLMHLKNLANSTDAQNIYRCHQKFQEVLQLAADIQTHFENPWQKE